MEGLEEAVREAGSKLTGLIEDQLLQAKPGILWRHYPGRTGTATEDF